MRKVVFAINMTADGYCSHEDGIPDEETYGFFTDLMSSFGVVLMGRVTYQMMVPYWPDVAKSPEAVPGRAFALAFDAVEKVVFSTTLSQVEGNTRIARSSLVDEVLMLREQPGNPISIDSLSLASQLSAHGLIDEYHILVHPVLAGKGPRFFETAGKGLRLDLVGSKTYGSGIVALHYRKR